MLTTMGAADAPRAAGEAIDGTAALPIIIGIAIAVTAATRRIAASIGAGSIESAICRPRFKL